MSDKQEVYCHELSNYRIRIPKNVLLTGTELLRMHAPCKPYICV